jgi:hypothetical protein
MIFLLLLLLITDAHAQTLSKPTSLPASGSFIYVDQIGNANNIFIDQTDTGRKQAAVISNGDVNLYSLMQSGTGNQTAMIASTNTSWNSSNNNNTLQITQSGAANNSATIQFLNGASNSNNTASITQTGAAGADKQFTLQLNGSGIGATVVQDNLLNKDSGSMSITCVAPPCSGYSYIKH